MMITYVKGDIFSSPAKIIVNAVNTVGVMGKGIALEFKNRYPDMFQTYKNICQEGKLDIGMLYLWKKSEKWVMLFPTKKHWRNPSKLEYIESGLKKFVDNWDRLGTDSIAFPRLGCGNGGLDWNVVKPLMEKYLQDIPMQVYVYVDNYNDPIPEHENISDMEKWLTGEMELEGYEKFKKSLENYLKSSGDVILDGKLIKELENKNAMICIGETNLEENQVCEIWNLVRDAGIISPEEFPYEYKDISLAFLEMMRDMRYAKNIFTSSDGMNFTKNPNAFQYMAN